MTERVGVPRIDRRAPAPPPPARGPDRRVLRTRSQPDDARPRSRARARDRRGSRQSLRDSAPAPCRHSPARWSQTHCEDRSRACRARSRPPRQARPACSAAFARRTRLKTPIICLGSRRSPPGGRRRERPDIAERGEPGGGFAVDFPLRHRAGLPAGQRVERAPQRRGAGRFARREVRLLGGVAREIVQLRRRRIDELPPFVLDRPQRRPVHVQQGKVAFAVRRRRRGRLRRGRPRAVDQRHQRPALCARQRRLPCGVQQRRRQIDAAHERRHAAARRQAPRPRQDHRHAQRRLVDEDRVRVLAVLTEALAVIADDGDDRGRQTAGAIQPIQHRTDRGIVERDLSIVGAVRKLFAKRRRRIVRIVRVVEVQPRRRTAPDRRREPRATRRRPPPCDRRGARASRGRHTYRSRARGRSAGRARTR